MRAERQQLVVSGWGLCESRCKKRKRPIFSIGLLEFGAPGRIRTSYPLVRSQVLYPDELRALCKEKHYNTLLFFVKLFLLLFPKKLRSTSATGRIIDYCFDVRKIFLAGKSLSCPLQTFFNLNQRYTRTGVLLWVRTFCVSLPSRSPAMPRRPCEAMKIKSQPWRSAALMIPS